MCRHPLVKKPCRSLFCFPSLARLEEDLEQAYYRSLDVSVATFRCALDYTRRCNRVYSERHWDEDHGFPRFSMEGQPSGFRGCLQVVSSGKLHVLVRMVASGCMDQLTLSLGGAGWKRSQDESFRYGVFSQTCYSRGRHLGKPSCLVPGPQ